MKSVSIAAAAAALFSMSVAALASDHNQGHITHNDVVISESVDVNTSTTMGRSGKEPPNSRAAASYGTSTSTTTTTTTTTADVTGPAGQLNQGNYGCNNCTSFNEQTTVTSETEESDAPGK